MGSLREAKPSFTSREFKRGEAPLLISSPSPYQGEGDKGGEVTINKTYMFSP